MRLDLIDAELGTRRAGRSKAPRSGLGSLSTIPGSMSGPEGTTTMAPSFRHTKIVAQRQRATDAFA
jgi:hypothetical protein